jgi:hypothetical protein
MNVSADTATVSVYADTDVNLKNRHNRLYALKKDK